ncbi:MAG: DUF1295 domain-containing protein [Pirellulaceae bacterium]|nr:DUF1295 domain-containing protein [Pirellulaceae bacterium]
MTSFVLFILINLAVALGMMAVLWNISVICKDASIVDPFWGAGFAILSVVSFLLTETPDPRAWLLMGMVVIWGCRLSIYLTLRNRGKGEDRRYGAMREKHGTRFWWYSLLSVFFLQGVIMWFVALPIQAGMFYGAGEALGWLDAVGVIVWLVGFIFESVGDYQMARFKSDPANKGQVMDRGLWGLTRHPNYFGDFMVWWGHYFVACASGVMWTILSPAFMSFLLIKVSGVALLEKDISQRRPGYREYIQTTNAFFPGRRRTVRENPKS